MISRISCGFHPSKIRARVVELRGDLKENRFRGVLGDESGLIPFISLRPFPFFEGDSIEIRNFSVMRIRGIPVLQINERSEMDLSAAPVEVRNPEIPISELSKRNVNFRVRLRGFITSVKMPSGVVQRCEICGRVLYRRLCGVHGAVRSFPDLHLKFILDDGSASALAIAFRDVSEKLLEMTLEECLSLWKGRSAEREIRYKILGKVVSVEASLVKLSGEFLRVEKVERIREPSSGLIRKFFEVLSDYERASSEDFFG